MKTLSVCLFFVAALAQAQNYPLPGSSASAPVICTGCTGNNAFNQANDGLPTWPYSTPITSFVGRWVDSQAYSDTQVAYRTARAGKVLIARRTRGNAPPRAYMQIGEGLGAFDLATLFTTKLPAGLVDVSNINIGKSYSSRPQPREKVIVPDGLLYPEAFGSGWTLVQVDSQKRLYDFDFDDRGYVYAAYFTFGWGIVSDSGQTGGAKLNKVAQLTSTDMGMPATAILSLQSGGHYYALVGDDTTQTRLYNVDNVFGPIQTTSSEPSVGIVDWAKNADGSRFAFIDSSGKVKIYDTASFVTGSGTPLKSVTPAASHFFTSVTCDDSGTFWVTEKQSVIGTSLLYRYAAGDSYAGQTYDLYGSAFNATLIRFGENRLAVGGNTSDGGIDVRIFDISSGTPVLVPANLYFAKYYSMPPSGYARPFAYTSLIRGLAFYSQNGKLYLIYGNHGLGDVYELQSTTLGGSFQRAGTFNPSSLETPGQIFAGDPIAFTSTTPIGLAPFGIEWNFDNAESDSGGVLPSTSGQTVTYQYGGLASIVNIENAKAPTVRALGGQATGTALPLKMKAPMTRLHINDNQWVFNTFVPPTWMAGSIFRDGSDGAVEGHFTRWTIDGVTSYKLPNESIAAGDCGVHSLTMTGYYGPYVNFSSMGDPFVTSLGTQYTIKPFAIGILTPADTSPNVTFQGYNFVGAQGTFSASTWAVTWTLRASNGGAVISTQTTNAAIGTIPNYVVPRANVNSGNYIDLTVTVDAAGIASTACKQYNTQTASQLINFTAGSATDLALSFTQTALTGTQNGGIVVTAKNVEGGTATDYTGTVHFTSSNNADGMPANVTFAPSDNGVKTICCTTYATIGTRAITVTDVLDSALADTQYDYAYGKTTLTLTSSAPGGAAAGTSITFTATLTTNATGAPDYTGGIVFSENGNNFGSGVITGGVATYTKTFAAGSHPIKARFYGDGNFAGSEMTITQNVTPLAAPANVSASSSGANVTVSWNAVPGAARYDLYRSSSSTGGFTLIGSTTSLYVIEVNPGPNGAFGYRVRAVDSGNTASADSAIDYVSTVAFTNSSLSGVAVKGIHFTELRTAINALRSYAGLAPFTYTNAITGVVKATDLAELRTALTQARTALSLSTSFTDPTLSSSVKVKATHIQELRSAVN